MQAGDLRWRVVFERGERTPNGAGGHEKTWGSPLRCFAHMLFLRGGESVMQARLAGRQTAVVTIRDGAAARQLSAEDRMTDLDSGTIYNVRTDPVPARERGWLEITVESGVAV